MVVIYKYELPAVAGHADIPLPPGAEFLCVKVQYGKPVLYVQQHDGGGGVNWRISAHETGKAVPWTRYLGTALLHNDSYVLHYFAGRTVEAA